MSKGFGSIQRDIINALSEPLSSTYWHTGKDIESKLGKCKQTIHRALKRLINESIVIRKAVKHKEYLDNGKIITVKTNKYLLMSKAGKNALLEMESNHV